MRPSQPSRLTILQAILAVDRLPVDFRKQPTFGLSKVEVGGPRLADGNEQIFDFVHMRGGLMLGRQLLKGPDWHEA